MASARKGLTETERTTFVRCSQFEGKCCHMSDRKHLMPTNESLKHVVNYDSLPCTNDNYSSNEPPPQEITEGIELDPPVLMEHRNEDIEEHQEHQPTEIRTRSGRQSKLPSRYNDYQM